MHGLIQSFSQLSFSFFTYIPSKHITIMIIHKFIISPELIFFFQKVCQNNLKINLLIRAVLIMHN